MSAAYLPYGGQAAFYEGMSPVNSFRAVFNYYFGTSYELLDDQHFISIDSAPYDFVPVTIEGRD